MKEILYDIKVIGKELDDGRMELIQLYAKNKTFARDIAEKVIKEKYGSFSYDLEVIPTELTEKELKEVEHALSETYLGLKVQCMEMNKSKFLKSLETFQGYNFEEIDENNMSCWIHFMNFTVKLLYSDNTVKIDETELYYKSCHSERVYVIRNNCEDCYIGT